MQRVVIGVDPHRLSGTAATGAHDAHSVAVAAVRGGYLRVLRADGGMEALRMLADWRGTLSRRRMQAVDRPGRQPTWACSRN